MEYITVSYRTFIQVESMPSWRLTSDNLSTQQIYIHLNINIHKVSHKTLTKLIAAKQQL